MGKETYFSTNAATVLFLSNILKDKKLNLTDQLIYHDILINFLKINNDSMLICGGFLLLDAEMWEESLMRSTTTFKCFH